MPDPIPSPYGPEPQEPESIEPIIPPAELAKHLNFIKEYLGAHSIFIAWTLKPCPNNDLNCPGHEILAGAKNLTPEQLQRLVNNVINSKPLP